MFKIGDIKIKNRVVLAPMAGISNPSYIKICEEMGLGYAVTELLSAEAIIRENKKTFDMLNGIDNLNIPIAVQLFGSNPETIAKAAKIIYETIKPDIIDINMGCPVPKVAIKSQAGSAILKNVDKVFEIVKSVVENVPIPVTVKIRSGWDKNNINAIEVAKACEKAGAKAICVHPRTRSQIYSGEADWNIIKKVKDNVSIPVIGNGDIKKPEDAKRMLDMTKCDAIMIGRAALGNPWIVKNTVNYLNNKPLIEVNDVEKINMCVKHLEYLLKYKSEKQSILEIRSHVGWYLKGISNLKSFKQKFYKVNNKKEFLNLISECLQQI